MANKMLVEVAVDTICPWCYMGKRRLEKALESAKEELGLDFETRYQPYFLNPHAVTSEATSRREMYIKKLGQEKYDKMTAYMNNLGDAEGISFKYGGTTGSTRDSHRIVQYALAKGGPEVQSAVLENVFSGFFENEKGITDLDFLADAAAEAGLDRDEVRKFLESDEGSLEVDMAISKFSRIHRLDGVPHYVFSDDSGSKISLSGAHEPHEFLEKLRKYKEKLEA